MFWKHGLSLLAAALFALSAGALSAQDQARDRDDQDRPRVSAGTQQTQTQSRQQQQERSGAAAGAQRTETQQPGAVQPGAVGARQPGREGRQAQGQQMERQLAAMLAIGNWEEVQLGQFASQKAQNPEVKEFAQKMVQDHTQFISQLQPFTPPGLLDDLRSESGSTGARTGQSATQGRTSAQAGQGQAGQGQAGQGQAGQGQAGQGQAGQAGANRQREGQAGADRQRDTDPSAAAQAEARTGGRQGGQGQMLQIHKQAAKQCLQRTKQMLNEKQGAEFDKCYIGQQVVMHTQMASKLEAMQNHGSPEFQQVIRQGLQKTEEHLKQAETIAQNLERSSSAGGERSGGAQQKQPRTQQQNQ